MNAFVLITRHNYIILPKNWSRPVSCRVCTPDISFESILSFLDAGLIGELNEWICTHQRTQIQHSSKIGCSATSCRLCTPDNSFSRYRKSQKWHLDLTELIENWTQWIIKLSNGNVLIPRHNYIVLQKFGVVREVAESAHLTTGLKGYFDFRPQDWSESLLIETYSSRDPNTSFLKNWMFCDKLPTLHTWQQL